MLTTFLWLWLQQPELQQEIEKAIRAAVADGRLKGTEIVDAQMTLTISRISLTHKVDGKIELA